MASSHTWQLRMNCTARITISSKIMMLPFYVNLAKNSMHTIHTSATYPWSCRYFIPEAISLAILTRWHNSDRSFFFFSRLNLHRFNCAWSSLHTPICCARIASSLSRTIKKLISPLIPPVHWRRMILGWDKLESRLASWPRSLTPWVCDDFERSPRICFKTYRGFARVAISAGSDCNDQVQLVSSPLALMLRISRTSLKHPLPRICPISISSGAGRVKWWEFVHQI